MIPGLARIFLATAALTVWGLILGAAPAHAQNEWARQVSEGGPVSYVVVGSLGSAFWSPPPNVWAHSAATVAVSQGPPQEILSGARGEDVFFTLPPAFRRSEPRPTMPPPGASPLVPPASAPPSTSPSTPRSATPPTAPPATSPAAPPAAR
jgi:hypothetical protein